MAEQENKELKGCKDILVEQVGKGKEMNEMLKGELEES